ncbi:MAPEG family protein [Shewanella submarina]|uniref:MAPEG family protein n=1 Tax=Shewanella submarina TaxID=2016376 RepID=A0ABV7GDG4_9GAMM|nr:MAPEG family protein [Shewanella submarina]MCL1037959.1 MAPEG family protein [Shewanella submarina]
MSALSQLLLPLIVLVLWSSVIWCWMYATRIPAIRANKIRLDPDAPAGEQMAKLPAKVRWKADNYNHLMEQPTVFFAIVLTLGLLGATGEHNIWLAWAYVVLRIIHSLVQTIGNNIMLRFMIFVLSNVPLVWLTINALLAL